MGSYTVSQLTTPLTRIILGGSATVGDRIIVTLNGADVSFTVGTNESGILDVGFATAMAAAINASTAIDPVSKVAINKAFCAEPAILRNPVTREESVCLISTQPGYDHAFTVSTRVVPPNGGTHYSEVLLISGTSPNFYVTVTDTIAPGSVLTTQVNLQSNPSLSVTETYTVVAGDTALSIAGHIATQLVAARPTQIKVAQNGSTLVIFNCLPSGTLTFATTLTPPAVTAKPTLYVSGRFLHDRYGNQVVLRGVNYPLSDEPLFPYTGDNLSEILKTGANAIRIQWYTNYYPDPDKAKLLTPGALGGFLDKCIAAKIVPIVELADVMCPTDTSPLNSQLIPWWTSADVLKELLPRQSYLILNLANELGQYQWVNDSDAAQAQYLTDYSTAFATMRKAGYVCPLMIDAPDCGISNQVFTNIGMQLVQADDQANMLNNKMPGNLLLSTHAYWAGYDGTAEVSKAVALSLPVIYAEIANKQDETVNGKEVYGYYGLDKTNSLNPNFTGYAYQDFLSQTLTPNQIGWLAWSWYPDSCYPRRMSNDGTFATLTAYGQDIVNNATYGLKSQANPAKQVMP